MHASISSRLGWLATASTIVLWSGCSDRSVEGVQMPSSNPGTIEFVALSTNRDVDVLFVIDNSGSMGEEQATLAASVGSFISVLERPGSELNYRIGVTTTDNGNPWCTTTPDAGSLQIESCLSRPEDFSFEGAVGQDSFGDTCMAMCPEQWATIDFQPSPLFSSNDAQPRPWIESIQGRTNLPPGLTTAQAFQCLAPQGIAGCGFESPLESMWKALRRSQTSDEPEFGFVREDAILSVIHVTDEADCSYSTEWESIFMPDGGQVFWSDPDTSSPSSAVCWNAGVACEGTGPYDCQPADFDVDGNDLLEGGSIDSAVLRPMSRYIDFLQEFESTKQRIVPDRNVLVSVLGGANADGSVTYQDQDAAEPEFQEDFGIGPGCESTQGQAVPPVRLRALANAFAVGDQQTLFSICESDYSSALEAIAESIANEIRPSCFPACAADTDTDTPNVLEPSCVITQESPLDDGRFQEVELPVCQSNGAVPDGFDTCYFELTGDARDEFCAEQGFNLEFRIQHRSGSFTPSGTSYIADCSLSQDRSVDCPDLP